MPVPEAPAMTEAENQAAMVQAYNQSPTSLTGLISSVAKGQPVTAAGNYANITGVDPETGMVAGAGLASQAGGQEIGTQVASPGQNFGGVVGVNPQSRMAEPTLEPFAPMSLHSAQPDESGFPTMSLGEPTGAPEGGFEPMSLHGGGSTSDEGGFSPMGLDYGGQFLT